MTAERLGHTSWVVDDEHKALTVPSAKVLAALAAVLDREGTASVREVMLQSGLASTSSVAHHLRKLALHGYIEPPVRNRPRGWQITARGWTAVPPA